MSGLSEADLKALGCSCPRVQGERRHHVATCCAPAVSLIVARAVNAALTEAADAIESDPALRLGHNISVVCSCLRCEVAQSAARIVRSRTT